MPFTTLRARTLLPALVLGLAGAGCADGEPSADDDFPLSDVDALYQDAPADRGLSLEGDDNKGDEALPASYFINELATPVRNQGSRGTCTIFATVGLMEALYVREGSLAMPDFSEQFLQWSAKVEVGSFQNTSGSNPQYNLQAINRFGIVEEAAWPYDTFEWGAANDPECTGDERPVRCYTNGDPPEMAMSAQRYTLPAGRWINPRADSLKGHLVQTGLPIVVSGSFFYQAWNHGRSPLPISAENSRRGYVLFPTEEDIAYSTMPENRAGHGFVLFGYDDALEVQRRDGNGEPMVDADGQPVMERGFFLFKNSWGTGRFGVENPRGAGFGWISYRYVEEYLTAYTAGLPDVRTPEVCTDARDNDRNGQIDCADTACAADPACMDPGDDLVNETAVPIPDNDPRGVMSSITVTEGGVISSMGVTVDIAHSFIGDLSVRLVREEDGREIVLHDRSGGSADDIVRTYDVPVFNGTDAAGTYTLHVADGAAQDVGTLNRWSIELTRCMSDCPTEPSVHTYGEETATPIPDNDSVTRTIDVIDAGEITGLRVSVDIQHEATIDLTIRFRKVGGREFILLTEDLSGDPTITRTFDVPGFIGQELQGSWQLEVVDGAAGDTGEIRAWSMEATVR
ncbi:MAG: proprotein convertase P-domain-containing protein [Sandaracinaceae bacterium]